VSARDRRLARGRAGVSPVVSDVMITAVVVICMSALLVWTVSYVRDPAREAAMERLAFEDVWFTEEGGQKVVKVYVRNYGPVEIVVDRVSVEPPGVIIPDADYLEGRGLRLEPSGGHGLIAFKFSWGPGEVYYIKVFTRRGSRFEVMAVAPS